MNSKDEEIHNKKEASEEFRDLSEVNSTPFKLPEIDEDQFEEIFGEILENPNLGAGIDISGVSGSGKSNLLIWIAIYALRRGIPITIFDPHGDFADSVIRAAQVLPDRIKKKFCTSSLPILQRLLA